MSQGFRRELTFNTISTLSLGLVSLLSIPLIINNLSLSEWVTVATCQAIGAIASIIVALGWNLTGSKRISQTNRSVIHAHYTRSIILQFLMLSVLSCIAYIAIVNTYIGSTSLYFLSFLSTAIVGLRANWLYLGLAASDELFKRETLPRITTNIIGCIILVKYGFVSLFFLFQILGLVLSIIFTYTWSRGYSTVKSISGQINKKSILTDLLISIPQFLYTFASFLPLFIVQSESAVNAAILALLLRLRIQFMTLISPVLDSLISKKLITQTKNLDGRRLKKILDFNSLLPLTFFIFPIFVLLMGKFVEHSNLKVPFYQIVLFTFYVAFNICLSFINSTQNSSNFNVRDMSIPIAGVLINSFGIIFGYHALQLTGTILMMVLSQIVMLILKFRLIRR